MNPNDRPQAELQNILVALNQYGERQRDQLNKTETLLTRQAQLLEKLTAIEARLVEIKAISPKIDPGPLRALLQETVGTINQQLVQGGASGTRKFHIQLLPEREAGEYIRTILVRCGMWLVILAGLYYGYKWAVHYSDNQKEIKLRYEGNDQIHRAWQYLYNRSGKNYRKRMDSALVKSAIQPPLLDKPGLLK